MGERAGMRVTGIIRRIDLHAIPSIMKGAAARAVTRIDLDIEDARDADGNPVDRSNLAGLPFEGPPELAARYAAGARVAIVTTTPSGTHIQRIDALD
ncbi:MAG TPA: hypothetical protein VL172_10500 [Kofleriaceae bacterium]|jgi:hypothetical protein|nr:hypothetical protein [Kofleriaceae bacterium]